MESQRFLRRVRAPRAGARMRPATCSANHVLPRAASWCCPCSAGSSRLHPGRWSSYSSPVPTAISKCGWQFVTLAPRTRAQGVGLGVADEFFLVRVPMQSAAKFAGDVRQVTKRGRAMSDFDIGNGPLTRVHARNPVLDVRFCWITYRWWMLGDQFLRLAIQLAEKKLDLALLPVVDMPPEVA